MRYINEDFTNIRKRINDQTEALKKRSERESRHQEEAESKEEAEVERIVKKVEFVAKGISKRLTDLVDTWKDVCEVIGDPQGLRVIGDDCPIETFMEIDEDFLEKYYEEINDKDYEMYRITGYGEVEFVKDYLVYTFSKDDGFCIWYAMGSGGPDDSDPDWRRLRLDTYDGADTYVEECFNWTTGENDIISSITSVKPLIDKLENTIETWAEEQLDKNEQNVIRSRD